MHQTTYLATLTDETPEQKINPFHFYGFLFSTVKQELLTFHNYVMIPISATTLQTRNSRLLLNPYSEFY